MKIIVILAALLGLTALLLGTGPPPPGNNGTVKIHEGNSEVEPIVRNEPHVCTFHVHFFFADPFQSGSWLIRSWPPTGDRAVVLSGSYNTSPTGEYRTVVFSLPNGHYKLEWEGRNLQNEKQKVFWVECEQPSPTSTKTSTPTSTATSTRPRDPTATRTSTRPSDPTATPTSTSPPPSETLEPTQTPVPTGTPPARPPKGPPTGAGLDLLDETGLKIGAMVLIALLTALFRRGR